MAYTPTKSEILSHFIKDDFAETYTPFSREALDTPVWVAKTDWPKFKNHEYEVVRGEIHGVENLVVEIYFSESDYEGTKKNVGKKNAPEVMTFGELLTYARDQVYGIQFAYVHNDPKRGAEFAPVSFLDIERYYDFMVSGAEYVHDPAELLRANKRFRENLSQAELRTGYKSIPVVDRYRAKMLRDMTKRKAAPKPVANIVVQRQPDKAIMRAIQNKIAGLNLGLTAEVTIRKNGDPDINKNVVQIDILMDEELTIDQAGLVQEALDPFEQQLDAQVLINTYVQTLPTTKELHEIKGLMSQLDLDLKAEVYFGKSKGPRENSVSIVLDVEYTRLLTAEEEDLLDQYHWALNDHFGIRVGVIRRGRDELMAAAQLQAQDAISIS